jgi:putative membrane protein
MSAPLLRAAAAAALSAGPAAAHGPGTPIGPADLWHHWSFDPFVLTPLAMIAWLYGRGVARLWRRAGRGRGIGPWRVAAFVGGVFALLVALVSPLDPLGETLLTAHMIQHGLLVTAAPLLLLAGRPAAALPWALPLRLRRSLARAHSLRALAESFAWMRAPLPTAAFHGAALWLWHAPAFFEAALASRALHTFEHVSFFATALLFWHSLGAAGRRPATIPPALAAAFATLIHGGFLGALITFAPQALYGWYANRGAAWGVDALSDQQLAGLVMWVPLGVFYLAACLALAGRLVGDDEPRAAIGVPTDAPGPARPWLVLGHSNSISAGRPARGVPDLGGAPEGLAKGERCSTGSQV